MTRALFLRALMACAAALALTGCPQPPPAKTVSASPPPVPSASAPTDTPAKTSAVDTPSGDGPKLTIYPAEIAPPEGQAWPVEIKPLPPALTGVPQSDRQYVETVFTIVLEATDAKIRLLHAIKRVQEGKPLADGGQRAKLKDKVRRYRTKTTAIQERLTQLTPPETLRPFHESLNEAIGQQLIFFKTTIEKKVAWKDMPELAGAKRSRYLLVRAWTLLKKAYPDLDAATSASFQSHLEALRLQ